MTSTGDIANAIIITPIAGIFIFIATFLVISTIFQQNLIIIAITVPFITILACLYIFGKLYEGKTVKEKKRDYGFFK